MNFDKIIRSWKDPEHRIVGQAVDHPAGEITLDKSAAGMDTATTTFVTMLACTFDSFCGTWWGTCSIDTFGCCTPPPPY